MSATNPIASYLLLKYTEKPFSRLSKAEVENACQECSGSVDELAKAALVIGQKCSICPISEFRVGASGITKSGSLLIGENFEFKGVPLGCVGNIYVSMIVTVNA
jgi:hypothetical protein